MPRYFPWLRRVVHRFAGLTLLAVLGLGCGGGEERDRGNPAPTSGNADASPADRDRFVAAQDADIPTDTLFLPSAGTRIDTLAVTSNGFVGRLLLLDSLSDRGLKRCAIQGRPFDIVNTEQVLETKLTDSLQFTTSLQLRIEYRPQSSVLIACPGGRNILLAFNQQSEPTSRPPPDPNGPGDTTRTSVTPSPGFGTGEFLLICLGVAIFLVAVLALSIYILRAHIGRYLQEISGRVGHPNQVATKSILDAVDAIRENMKPLADFSSKIDGLSPDKIGSRNLLDLSNVQKDLNEVLRYIRQLEEKSGGQNLSQVESRSMGVARPETWTEDALGQPQGDGEAVAALIDADVLQQLRELNSEQARQKVAENCKDYLRRLDRLKDAIMNAATEAGTPVESHASAALARLDAIRSWIEIQQRGASAGYLPLVAYVQPNHQDTESVLSRIAADLRASLRILGSDPAGFDRRIADVLSAALPVLNAANRMRNEQNPTPSWLKALRESVDLKPFDPVKGDQIIQSQHDPGDDMESGAVGAVSAPGYFFKGKVLIRARVRRSEGSGRGDPGPA